MRDSVLVRCATLYLSLLAVPAQAMPSLRVRAATRLSVQVERSDTGPVLAGSLVDDSGAPLADGLIELDVEADGMPPVRSVVRTRDDGSFTALLPAGAIRLLARARFEGDSFHDRASYEGDMHLSLAPVSLGLRLHSGAQIDLDRETVTVETHADSVAGNAGLEIVLTDELQRVLARTTTDRDGAARATIESEEFAPGAGTITARTPGDAMRAPASAHLSVLRSLGASVTLEADADPARRTVLVRGHANSSRGPLQHKTVSILVGARFGATVVTDRSGHFSTTLTRQGMPDGAPGREVYLQARIEPDVPWLRAAHSESITVQFGDAGALAGAWLLLPAGCALAVVAWLAMGTGARRLKRPRRPQVKPGVQMGSAVPRAARTCYSVAGHIEDVDSGLPLPAATITLTSQAGTPCTAPVNEDGDFTSGTLSSGVYALTAHSPGYTALQTRVVLPHAGEGSSVLVALSGIRTLALDAHRAAVQQLAPASKVAPSSTPRDGLAQVDAAVSSSAGLARLTSLVEETAFAPRTPTLADLEQIRAQAGAASAAIAAAAPPAPRQRR